MEEMFQASPAGKSALMTGKCDLMKRLILFAVCVMAIAITARAPLSALISLAYLDERYVYILLMPFIGMLLFIWPRKRIREVTRYCPQFGIPIALSGLFLFSITNWPSLVGDQAYRLTISIASIVASWLGTFIFFYGLEAFWISIVSWFCLALVVPLPAIFLDKLAVILQVASADAASIIFRLTGMPALRQGVIFSLPGIDIEIAKECSGIRSGIALVLANSLAAHLLLRTHSKKIALALLSIPFVICKNAIRIVTLAWLGVYVDRGFFFGELHHNSGIVFSILDAVVLIAAITILQRSEAGALTMSRSTRSRLFI